ncbi:unnamed protein product [Tetraodon nigroviridis]|uniref:(spotted green pufferfish) hypothetical protein n=1 Tax=Tetraodon nigroviridis TaxID=99883 RepID=Q4THM1_TETNG|nr:unnamed protein product [Tetraodon nigroviridis]
MNATTTSKCWCRAMTRRCFLRHQRLQPHLPQLQGEAPRLPGGFVTPREGMCSHVQLQPEPEHTSLLTCY